MSEGNIIAFNPCSVCSKKNCLMCELNFRRKGAIKSNEWISVEERLPEREGTYLVYTYKGAIKFGEFRRYLVSDEPQFDYSVTHWMPLPEAPKGGAE